jgi:hypothetical protein
VSSDNSCLWYYISSLRPRRLRHIWPALSVWHHSLCLAADARIPLLGTTARDLRRRARWPPGTTKRSVQPHGIDRDADEPSRVANSAGQHDHQIRRSLLLTFSQCSRPHIQLRAILDVLSPYRSPLIPHVSLGHRVVQPKYLCTLSCHDCTGARSLLACAFSNKILATLLL